MQTGGEGAAGCMCVFIPWCELASVAWRCASQAGLFGLSSGLKKKGM